jgi:hypothetical protein
MAAASARLIRCMFNTQLELNLKHAYEPRLNEGSIQNTTFKWRLAPIKSWRLIFLSFCFCVSNSVFAMCNVELERAVSAASTVVPLGGASSANENKAVIRRFYSESIKNGFIKFRDDKDQANQKEFLDYAEQEIKGLRQILSSNGRDQNTDLRASMLPYWEMVVCLGNSQRSSKSSETITSTQRSPASPAAQFNNLPQQSQQQSQQSQQVLVQPQQNQPAQQQSQQAQQQAQQTQARADQARQGQRRRHEPENEASHCIQPDFGGLYGGMKNTCDFKVWYTYCGYRPKENSWLTGMSCEKQSFGSDSVSPGRTSASHTKGVESIHWIACKEPAWALDAEFVPGQGIKGRCYTVGGK